GFSAAEATPAGDFTVNVAVWGVQSWAPVIVTAVAAVTVLLATVNVAVVAPAATVTDAGTVAAFVLLLASATTAPPAGAAVGRVRSEERRVGKETGVRWRASRANAEGGVTRMR